MKLPRLPKPVWLKAETGGYYSESQIREYVIAVLEAAAQVAEDRCNYSTADAIRKMKEKV